MQKQIDKLKVLWEIEGDAIFIPATDNQILSFQSKNNLVIPKDLAEYFILLNGTNERYDERFFQFYSFDQFKNIDEELKNWGGVPDYRNIVNTLLDYETYFVFADYSFHMFSYAIRLYPNETSKNEVLVVCGDQYSHIANSFSEFIDLYIVESIELQLNI
jgi:hypothetical protein